MAIITVPLVLLAVSIGASLGTGYNLAYNEAFTFGDLITHTPIDLFVAPVVDTFNLMLTRVLDFFWYNIVYPLAVILGVIVYGAFNFYLVVLHRFILKEIMPLFKKGLKISKNIEKSFLKVLDLE